MLALSNEMKTAAREVAARLEAGTASPLFLSLLASTLYEALGREQRAAACPTLRLALAGARERCLRAVSRPERLRDEISAVIAFLASEPQSAGKAGSPRPVLRTTRGEIARVS